MGLKDRLRTWAQARYNVELELYLEAFRDGIERADRTLQGELEGILGRSGFHDATELNGVSGAVAYEAVTRFMLDIQQVIAHRLPSHSAETWLFRSRQHILCDLLAVPPQGDLEVRGRMSGCQLLPRVITVLGTDLPTRRTSNPVWDPVTGDDVIDFHVVLMLLEWYSDCLLARRRVALGGTLTAAYVIPVPVLLPTGELPPSLAAKLSRTLPREERSYSDMLAGLGLDVPPQWMPPIGTADLEFVGTVSVTRFFVAGVHTFEAFQVGTRNLSKVRLFEPSWVNAPEILEPLQFLGEEIERAWHLSPRELVAGAVSLCLLARDAWSDSVRRPEFDRLFSTCGLFVVDLTELRRHMEEVLPEVSEALGTSMRSSEVGDSVEKILRRFTETPREYPPSPLKRRGPLPFVLVDGDRALIDLYSMPIAFSSVLEGVPFSGRGAQEKGPWFEDAVRRSLLASHHSIVSLPSMEQEFVRKGKTIGEADVVVAVADTAFLIECKSRRHTNTDACLTLDEAQRRRRHVASWAQQARRTAEYVAASPVGANHHVPEQIQWIIPLVCSPMLEVDWDGTTDTDLIPGEVSIFMRPGEVVEFILGGRWNSDAARSWQVRVRR